MSRRRKARRAGGRVGRWVARIVPLGLLAIGLYLLNDAREFMQDAAEAEGVVVSVDVTTTRDSETGAISYSYRPNIRFTAADGREHVSRTHISSSNYDYSPGARLAILYDPADPSDLRIDSFWSIYLLPGLFTVFGAVFFVLFGVLGVGRRRRAEAPTTAPPAPEPEPAPRREEHYSDQPPTVRR